MFVKGLKSENKLPGSPKIGARRIPSASNIQITQIDAPNINTDSH